MLTVKRAQRRKEDIMLGIIGKQLAALGQYRNVIEEPLSHQYRMARFFACSRANLQSIERNRLRSR